jgi:catechol 2,3-dioxygenase-like lactoylglutathione lyase family enzyme
MAIVKPAHYSIRTTDLDRSQRFYTEVLQLRVGFRPPFDFPGVWLYADQEESEFGAVHLIGVDPASREGLAGYAATKAFVLYFSEAIQHELTEKGVHVMAACPGPTATGFFDGTSTNMSPRDFDSSLSVVEKTLEAFERGKSVAYPGRARVRLATWLSRFLPRTFVVRIAALATGKMGLHNHRGHRNDF